MLSKDLSIHVKGNYGYNHNVLKFADEPINDETYVHRYRSTGYSLGQSWGYRNDYSNGNGFFNSEEELENFLEHTQYGIGDPRVGDFIYKDMKEDGIVNDKDRSEERIVGNECVSKGRLWWLREDKKKK